MAEDVETTAEVETAEEQTTTEQTAEETQEEPQLTAEEQAAAEEAARQQEWEEQRQVEQKPWFQKKIDKLTAKRRQAERQAAAERQKADQLQQMLDKAIGKKPTETAKPVPRVGPKPKPDDFENDADYVEAIADWKYEQRVAKDAQERQKSEEQKQLEQQRRQEQDWWGWFGSVREATIQAGETTYRDWDDVVPNAPEDIINVETAAAIFETDNPAAVMYHLCKNQDEGRRIAAIKSPFKRAVELGKLETKLNKPAPKPTTKAPPVMKGVDGTKQPSTVPDPGKDPAAWIKMRNEGKI